MALALGRDFEELWAFLTAPLEPGPVQVIDHDPIMHTDWEQSCPMVGGHYRHYKGGLYVVVAIATNEGSKERVVVYRGSDGHVWARPLRQFFAPVQRNAGDRATVTRFAYDPQSAAVSGSTDRA